MVIAVVVIGVVGVGVSFGITFGLLRSALESREQKGFSRGEQRAAQEVDQQLRKYGLTAGKRWQGWIEVSELSRPDLSKWRTRKEKK